jgi:hypothetical protein
MSPQLELSTFLGAIRRRWRMLMALRAGGVAVTGLAVAVGLFALLARAVRPASDALLAIAVLAVLAGLAWVVRAVRSVGLPDDRRLARFIEERRPEFEDGLVTAVEVRDRGHAFGRVIVADAALRARTVEPASVVRTDEIRRAAGQGAAACALLLVAGGASLGPFEHALDAARVRLFPSRISIVVEPGNARVVAGQPLTVRARVTGVPGGFDAKPTIGIRSATSSRRQQMVGSGDRFELRLNAVNATFKYDISAAGVRSPDYEITVLHRPALEQIDVSYEYPPYTGMPPRKEEDGGDIYAPAGTRVTVRVHGNKKLASGMLRLGDRSIPLQAGGEPSTRETSFTVVRDGSYRVDLTDADGLKSDPSAEYFVRVTDDRPPEVRIVRPEGDRQVTPLEEVEIAAQADDDYQVGSLDLVYAVGAQPERVVPLSPRAGPSVSGSHLLLLENLEVKPGDMVRAYARAREARKGGRETRSEMLLLEVAPFDQQFAFAQSQAGAGGGGGDLESLIQAEKNILNGTWNLLRRSTAGRSDSDVKALSGAQAELKERAQAAAGGVRPGRRGGRAADAENPLAAAAEAMGKAAEVLGRGRLQEAVPHEMEALTQLGRALAENKRREVTQQSGAGGGGGGASQDLSTLFDRELLRQQQTNYENRNGSSREDARDRESDLQKRVRELARRQDDLARQQRQLAQQQISEEERKRQLERLTREQEELRQQAEQLARDLQRQQGRERSGQSQTLREAADDMRASSGEMRRNNARSASQRGGRAADRLRDAQQSLGAAQSQTQSIGELQLEAQQLSDAQRRMEQQKSGQQGGSQGAADEQERLAERADRLRKAARALAGGHGDQNERRAAGQAARELERERVAERMREQADQMRQGSSRGQTTPGTTADGSRLSTTLDRVARQLAAGADAATRKLAEDMARNRSARQQLEEAARRLERAQRDGDAGAQGELRQELQRAEQMLRELQEGGDRPESGMGRTAPEQHEWSRSAPGLESFKQDFTRWEQLKREITLALEKRDLSLAQQLKGKAGDAVKAGSVEGLPEQYRAQVSRYFEALARAGRRPRP